MQKIRHYEKKNGHLPQNLRPPVVSTILAKFHRKDKDQDEQRTVLQQFFEMLKATGKAKIIRGTVKDKSLIYSRDIIYSTNAAVAKKPTITHNESVTFNTEANNTFAAMIVGESFG